MPTSRDTLKDFFSARKKPIENHFHQWLDSFIHKGGEDGIFLDENGNIGIAKSGSGSTPSQAGNFIGLIAFQGRSSSGGRVPAAAISVVAQSNFGEAYNGSLRFSTIQNNLLSDRLRIDENIHVIGSLKIQEGDSETDTTWEIENEVRREELPLGGILVGDRRLNLKLGGTTIFSFSQDGHIYDSENNEIV